MLDRLVWAWKVLRSKTFIVATEKEAACRINVRDPFSFDTIVMLAGQYTSVVDFKEKLEDLLREHEEAAEKQFGINPNDFMEKSTKQVKKVKAKENK